MDRRVAGPRHFREPYSRVAIDRMLICTDNPHVIVRRACRPVTALLLTATTFAAALLPPTHIHLAADDHDHHHAVSIEHAHWAGHFQLQPALDDNDHDGGVLYVDHPARLRVAPAYVPPPQVAVIALLPLSDAPAFSAIGQRAGGNAVRDGPALLAFLLRGPPFVL